MTEADESTSNSPRVLILGGYGNFGARIAASLLKENIPVIIAGRQQSKAQAMRIKLSSAAPANLINIAVFDANKGLAEQLTTLKPAIVINTAGPYQGTDYSIAKICIENKVHYIDLADAREFVNGISCLDQLAKDNNVLAVSGASSVPGLSSAVLDHYQKYFSNIDSVIYGITPGQKSPRGLATTQSILTYLGKPLKPWGNQAEPCYGWQDLYLQTYPELGKRWMANCDVPDLDIFIKRYKLKTLRFSAGMENPVLHLGMWLTSWLIRLGLPIDLSKHADNLLSFSHYFDILGSENGGMHILIKGFNSAGNPLEIKWFLIAKNNDGPQIPCAPALILTKKLLRNELSTRGAMPCVGMVTLDEYMQELWDFDVKEKEVISENNQ